MFTLFRLCCVLQEAYKTLGVMIREIDGEKTRGGLLRCSTHSRRIVWLCPEHQKSARGTIENDELDAEDVFLEETPAEISPQISLPVASSVSGMRETLGESRPETRSTQLSSPPVSLDVSPKLDDLTVSTVMPDV